MAKTTLFTFRKGPHIVKIRKDTEWNDHIAEVWPHGQRGGDAQDYHGWDDLEGTVSTGKSILNHLAKQSGHSAQPMIGVDHRKNRKPLEEEIKTPNINRIYEAYAKVYAKDTLGIENLDEVKSSGTVKRDRFPPIKMFGKAGEDFGNSLKALYVSMGKPIHKTHPITTASVRNGRTKPKQLKLDLEE